jgi:hypothetical protein
VTARRRALMLTTLRPGLAPYVRGTGPRTGAAAGGRSCDLSSSGAPPVELIKVEVGTTVYC